jgi:hypothetical protein
MALWFFKRVRKPAGIMGDRALCLFTFSEGQFFKTLFAPTEKLMTWQC